ncbi:hypothetical protein FDE76_15290 [Clostridium botulinum]|uniref:Uncharacterized protein n=2 Tax=Clostridium botulinum TaxID=1491 RepID=A0A0A0UUH9_CLOBO|nr:hypothetical protein [Clostridium botulinum]ACD14196.1 conserved hypothetical protein [Clostridium botulinum B str. Eklund 17B (NRP)]AIW54484.1 hypothetical protein [Clostridium botulinum]AIW54538.1 hypothetical protein [Clostridium botulinum]MBY6977851.1 hypothetical protein [Clostridium botulinum]MBY7002316.1 hypothetical protein [Clostridium botulinum]
MKKKLIAGVLATATVVGGVIPTTAFADVKEADNQIIIEEVQNVLPVIESESTTGSAIKIENDDKNLENEDIDEIQDLNQNEEIIVDEQQEIGISEVKELKATIDENITIGEKVNVKVIGFNATGEEIKLDKEKISYKWFADKEIVGNNDYLNITDDMANREISCRVDYRN